LPRAQLRARCAETTIHIVPALYDAVLTAESARDIESRLAAMVRVSEYSASGALAEGLYIRVEDAHQVVARFKYRRKTFVCGRADFRTNIERNQLRSTTRT
jgi:hypothetical protein